ncbi:kif7, partial [Symbiodinium natans]
GRRGGHDVDRDPLLALDPPNLLRRYLIAEDWDVDKAAERLRSTIAWRRDWRVMEYYQPGRAQYLYDESTNPGSEMYFGDSLHFDRSGRPYMVGRFRLCNAERMHPWRHLRAGIYALDRFALKIIQKGCGYGSYLLDIGRVAERSSFSGTGGGQDFFPQESKNPYYQQGAGKDAPAELLERYGELNSGMAVLRAALRIAGDHYPELLSRVVFLRSDWLFSLAFKVFRLWANKKTRDKFLFIGGKADPPMAQLQDWFHYQQLPAEFGGQGYSLDGDNFLRRAVDHLDAEAKQGWELPETLNTNISISQLASTEVADAGEDASNISSKIGDIFSPFQACCGCLQFSPPRRRTQSRARLPPTPQGPEPSAPTPQQFAQPPGGLTPRRNFTFLIIVGALVVLAAASSQAILETYAMSWVHR